MTRVNNIITEKNIENWTGEKKILIHADCGTGKTYFILNDLYDYCRRNGKKMIYFCNRNNLKRQIELEIAEKRDVIKLINYQKMVADFGYLPQEFFRQCALGHELNQYDFIVADEAHYFFADSELKKSTSDILLTTLSENVAKPVIFMTATPQILKRVVDFDDENIYRVAKPPQVENAYYYTNDACIERILENMPPNDKAIVFCRHTTRGIAIAHKFDGLFVCSESHKNFEYVDKDKRDRMIERQKFDERVLCTTSVLDCGVNIIDRDVRHIICDFTDIITIIQCIGRKRFIDENDKITIYIKNNPRLIHYLLHRKKEKIRTIRDYIEMDWDEFSLNYKDDYYSVGLRLNDEPEHSEPFTVINALYQKLQYDIEIFDEVVSTQYASFIERFCKEVDIDFGIFRHLELDYDIEAIEEYLNEWLYMEMYGETKQQFSRFFENDVHSKNLFMSLRYTGKNKINKYLLYIGLGKYRIESRQNWCRNSEHYMKTYWKVTKGQHENSQDDLLEVL